MSTGKATKARGKKQINAALPEQLVLDFNAAATELSRDALLEDLIFSFLEKMRPDSPSVVQLREKRRRDVELNDAAAAGLGDIIAERRALRIVRIRAEEVVAISTVALMRKPPRKSKVATMDHQKRGT